jgi:hypothetical protein
VTFHFFIDADDILGVSALAGTKKVKNQFHQFDMKKSFVDGLGGVWWGSVVVRSFVEWWKRARVRQYISDMLRGGQHQSRSVS